MGNFLDRLRLIRFRRKQADIARIGAVFLGDPAQLRRGLARRAGLGSVRTTVLLRRMIRWGWLEDGWQVQAGWHPPLACYLLTDCGRRCLSSPEINRAIASCLDDELGTADRVRGALR